VQNYIALTHSENISLSLPRMAVSLVRTLSTVAMFNATTSTLSPRHFADSTCCNMKSDSSSSCSWLVLSVFLLLLLFKSALLLVSGSRSLA
jgi:hypothetical protein